MSDIQNYEHKYFTNFVKFDILGDSCSAYSSPWSKSVVLYNNNMSHTQMYICMILYRYVLFIVCDCTPLISCLGITFMPLWSILLPRPRNVCLRGQLPMFCHYNIIWFRRSIPPRRFYRSFSGSGRGELYIIPK